MRLMSWIFAVIAIGFLSSCNQEEEITIIRSLPENVLSLPRQLFVNDQLVIVVDGPPKNTVVGFDAKKLTQTISIDLAEQHNDSFKLTPGQFLELDVGAECLLLGGYGHIYQYDYRGQLISDNVSPPNSFQYGLLGDRYIRKRHLTENYKKYVVLESCDQSLDDVKEITRVPSPATRGPLDITSHNLKYQVYQDRIYVTGRTDDFVIDVFDRDGILVDTISIDYERVVMDQKYQNQVFGFFEFHPAYRGRAYKLIHDRLVFPDLLPAIRFFRVVDDRIYVITYRASYDSSECLVIDLAGNVLTNQSVVFTAHNIMIPVPFTFYKGRLYQLMQNTTAGIHDLRSTKILIE